MKKLIQFSAIFVFIVLFMVACSKKEQAGPVINATIETPIESLSGGIFDALNEAIVRFDPIYLRAVYKDKRSDKEINDLGMQLLYQLNLHPDDLLIQNKLIDLYRFNSLDDFKKTSGIISTNSNYIIANLFKNETKLTGYQIKMINDARKKHLLNKIQQLEKAVQKQSAGLWTDNADWILNQFHYYTIVGNMELGLDLNEGGGDGACNESCCYEYKACLTTAASSYRSNFILLGSSLAASGGALGSMYGSIIPFIGTGAVGLGGGILGGVTGFVQAVNIYIKNQEACLYNYKACVLRKNEK
jgi:hypothetical protein